MERNIVVGVSAARRDFDRSGFIREYVNEHYSDSITRGGGVPIILPITDDESMVSKYIDMIDYLVLSGGQDISPKLYNEEFLPEVEVPDLKRDSFDMLLIKYAIKKKIPILGICRGMQIINVYFGGTLYQDLRYNENIFLKHIQGLDSPSTPVHKIKLQKGSFLGDNFGDELWVNSYHHQGIKELGEGLIISACSNDGLIEGIENKDGSFILGVQWHPEMMFSAGGNVEMEKLFKKLLKK